ncbi:hypothetical protein EBT11_08085 [bacterium]|nr:hypothetical protein [bacterium]
MVSIVTFSAWRELTGAKKRTTTPTNTAAPEPTQTHLRDMFFFFSKPVPQEAVTRDRRKL